MYGASDISSIPMSGSSLSPGPSSARGKPIVTQLSFDNRDLQVQSNSMCMYLQYMHCMWISLGIRITYHNLEYIYTYVYYARYTVNAIYIA